MIGEPRMGARSGDRDPKYQSHDEHRDREKNNCQKEEEKERKTEEGMAQNGSRCPFSCKPVSSVSIR